MKKVKEFPPVVPGICSKCLGESPEPICPACQYELEQRQASQESTVDEPDDYLSLTKGF
jgi:hypothetical protein